MNRFKLFAWVGVLMLALIGVSGCLFRPLIYDVVVSDTTISPNADGQSDVTRIEYKLSQNATMSIYFQDAAGDKHYFRQDRDRSRSVGSRPYRIDFGGVIPREAAGFRQDRMLPDGDYVLVLEATGEHGNTFKVKRPFTIVDADTTPPELAGFALDRHVFTPNRDGIDDRVNITYQVTKDATVQVYLLAQDGKKYPIGDPKGAGKVGEAGSFYHDYSGGIDEGAEPPPDGSYLVVATSQDKVGSKVTVTDTLEIKEGGVPLATIVGLEWEVSETSVPLGGTLYFTATVENYGKTPIRTIGPESGTQYTTEWNFATLGGWTSSGAFRIGMGFDNCPLGDYMWRWSVGQYSDLRAVQRDDETLYYLDPGQKVLITGSVVLNQAPPRNPTPFWLGLIHEDVEIVNNRADPKWITVLVEPDGPWGARATPTPMVETK
ncbi:MAG: hypothetical protein JW934_21890 [Anaerolineae bacterium]|nr:hypothetical protein [Anaerolineae bacterium]